MAWLFIAAIAIAITGSAWAGGPPQPMIGQDAPGFALETVAEGTLALGDLEGRYVVLHFGASW